ncbi:uncharacterized protein LOC130406242 isoform X2 [Gadus chalcogrammus]|uniref:uncharacterized protein LOC130406242 isoform X2 n=1 Tax=Gadus chalcogrammus TaxID=1042646 RepID=UPI0024C495C1|nr:uncharacterized protein LOC130406242 isoform X2 [Gadus chalcogrammus]
MAGYEASSPGPDLSDEQLQDVAKTLRQKWEQVALHLGLKKEDLDEIKKEKKDEYMQRRNMLRLWKDRRPGKATAQDLLRGLEDMKDLSVETCLLLEELRRIRSELINRLSDDDVIGLLHYLRKKNVLNGQEEKTVEGQMTSEDRARCLIDTVMRKGERESRLMVDYLTERHPDLCWTLGLTPTSAWIRFRRSQKSFSRKEGPGLMSPSRPLKMHEGDSELEEMHFKSHCEKCKAAQQSPEYKKVTPTKITKWSFELQLEGEGTYECSATGLVFEVSEQALVRYSVLSWFQFSDFLKDSWRPAGSIYDVDVVNKDPSVLKFIHFPHSLCLAEPLRDLSFSVLHVKDRHADIESTVGFTASHVEWRVSSLSLLGVIRSCFLCNRNWKHHGLVLIYKELNKKDFILRVYLGSNSSSEIKAIEEQVLKARKNGIKITETYKHLTCRLEEKFYCLASEPEGQIEPTDLEFTTAVLGLKGFFRVRFRKLPPFRLFLKDSLINEPLPFLIFTIEEEDWHSEEKPEVTSDLPSSPRLSLEHPAGHPTSSTTSSPPATSRATQAAGHPTSSTTSSPPAPSRATQAAGHPTSSTTSSPPAPSRATQAAGHPTSSTTSSPPATSRATQAEGELRGIRSEFVKRVSISVIRGLLDDLWQQKVFSTEDKDSVMEEQRSTTDRARFLIDKVMKKGERASQVMIDSMKVRDNPLCITLGL